MNRERQMNRSVTIIIQYHCFSNLGPQFWTNSAFKGKVPASCCEDSAKDEKLCAEADAFTVGCLDQSTKLASTQANRLIFVLICAVIFQTACMIMAHFAKAGTIY